MTTTMLRLAVALLATGAVATAAYAATPQEGTISNAAPEVTWSGSVTSSGAQWNAWTENPNAPCANAQMCDPFMLKVASAGDVTIKGASGAEDDQGGDVQSGFRVTKPDGSVVFASGVSTADQPFEFKLEKAAPGDYKLEYVDSFICCGPLPYNASASLPAAAPAEPPKPQPQPQPQPKPQGQSAAPQQQQPPPSQTPSDFTLTAKAPKVSARKTRKSRRFSVPVTTSRAIQKLTVTLKKGKKTLGTGTISPFSGKGGVAVRSKRRLKKGSYVLVVVGTDQGVTVARTLKLKITR